MDKIRRCINIFLMVILFQVVCLAQEKTSPYDEYIVKPEDKLSISVWKHEDLSQNIKVAADGTIDFPLIGKVKAAGFTLNELKDKITYLLEKDYLVNPLVTITMEKENLFIYTYGEVKNPGAHTLESQMTLLKAITIAGGLTDFASSVVYVKRKVGEKEQRIKVNINSIIKQESVDIPLRPDDIIVVPRRFF